MELKIITLFEDFKNTGLIDSIHGNGTSVIEKISPVETGSKGSLVFIDHKKFLEFVKKNKPTAVIANPSLKTLLEEIGIDTILYSKNVNLAQAVIRQKYADRNFFESEWERIHSSAVIHESVKIPESCMIGPNVVIGKDVQIGERSIIYANTVVETSSTIGEDCIIYSNVTIGYSTQIGNRVTIKSGSVIGGEGYGFAQDSNRKSHRIPQTGIVVIEDDVVIGANNCVDRATYFETRIGRGTKFDNLCHVAHNVKIGEDCLLTAGFIVAGSTTIGNRLIASGQTGILDHLTIVDDVVLVHKPGLSEDILEKGIYAGMPIQPLQSYLKNAAIIRKLTDLRSKVIELEKKIK